MRTNTGTEAPHEETRFRQPLRRSKPFLMKRWDYLWRDEFVEMRLAGQEKDTGWVDDISPDGTIIWIHLTGGRGRVMFHLDDGLYIWRVDTRILQHRSNAKPF